MSVSYGSIFLRDDPEIAVIALRQNWKSLRLITDRLQHETSIVRLAIDINPLSLEFAGDGLKDDKDIVSYSLAKNGLCLK